MLNNNPMPNTYSQIYIQVVFTEKGGACIIKEDFREELQKYMAGIIKHKNQKLPAIYCMQDHTHIFLSLKPGISISDLVRDIKSNTTLFINEKKWVAGAFSWQEGFGAFSYHKSQAKQIVNYILRQPDHHRKISFREEYLNFLREFEIEFDNKYLFEFYDTNHERSEK